MAISWNASAGATSYRVKRAATPGGPYTTLGSPVTTTFIDTTAAAGVRSYYVVSAVDGSGESANLNEVSTVPCAVCQSHVTASVAATLKCKHLRVR